MANLYAANCTLGSEVTPKALLISDVAETRVLKASEVKHPPTTFSFTEESPLVDTVYGQSGLNDTFTIPGSDAMVRNWLMKAQNDPRRVSPGPDGMGHSHDAVAGSHNAASGDRLGERGNRASLDSHVDAYPRSETFLLAWPK